MYWTSQSICAIRFSYQKFRLFDPIVKSATVFMVIDRAKLPLGILLTYVGPAIHGVSAFLRRVYAIEACQSTCGQTPQEGGRIVRETATRVILVDIQIIHICY